MKKCIKCNNEHDGSFGSGKYCNRSCANSRTHSAETKAKIKLKRKKQIFTKETKQKMSKAQKGRIITEETKLRMSKAQKGRTFTEETKQKMSKSRKAYFKNMTLSEYDEYCKQQRLVSITTWESKHGVYPNYNPLSIPIIEQKAKDLGITDLQHAENGGEFHIKELGYWVDGYSKEKNVVIEYYEDFHESQKDKDLRRQDEIIKHLGCEFIIIKNK